jgi:putative protease
MPKITAPITSFAAARRAISGGVDEIYCGVEIPGINYTGLSTRPSWCSVPTYDELERVTSYAHEHGAKVAVTTDFPFLAEIIEDKIRRHILSCAERGIDALIATDIGIILMAKNMSRLNIPIYASTYLAPTNYEVVNLLKQMGAKRVMLERHLTIDEIRQIVRLCKGVEIEVFVHGPGCSNINVNCYACGSQIELNPQLHKAGVKGETLCQTNYEVYKLDKDRIIKIAEAPVLDAYSCCSLCQLPELVGTGVTGLKIVGREFDQEYQGEIAKIYRELTDLLEHGQLEDFKKKSKSLKDTKYFSAPCRQKRCYYSSLFHAPYKIPLAEDCTPRDKNENCDSD